MRGRTLRRSHGVPSSRVYVFARSLHCSSSFDFVPVLQFSCRRPSGPMAARRLPQLGASAHRHRFGASSSHTVSRFYHGHGGKGGPAVDYATGAGAFPSLRPRRMSARLRRLGARHPAAHARDTDAASDLRPGFGRTKLASTACCRSLRATSATTPHATRGGRIIGDLTATVQ